MRMLELLKYLNPDAAHINDIAAHVYRDQKPVNRNGWPNAKTRKMTESIINNAKNSGWLITTDNTLDERQWRMVQAAFGPHGKLTDWNRHKRQLTPVILERELFARGVTV